MNMCILQQGVACLLYCGVVCWCCVVLRCVVMCGRAVILLHFFVSIFIHCSVLCCVLCCVVLCVCGLMLLHVFVVILIQGVYDFRPCDKIVDWAIDKGMQVKGHTLCWHVTTPEFAEDMSASRLREALYR